MRKQNIVVKTLFFLLMVFNAKGQNEKSGVYLTLQDYLNNKLSYEINCKTEKHKIKLNEFLNKSYITVFHNDQKINLGKDTIYGVVYCDEPLVRFQDKEHYYLDEKGPIWIFFRMENKATNKTFFPERKYYFSIKGDGKLMELSKENLRNAFPVNHKFHDLLDAQFSSNVNIGEYDSFHKMFKVNHLLQQSMK